MNNTTSFVRWQHWSWIVPEALNSAFIILSIWILISLIHYGNKSKKWLTRSKNDTDKLNAGMVLMAAVFSAVMAIARFITSQLVFNIGYSLTESKQCKIVADASIITFCLATFAAYVYLWVRQLVFYTNHMLNTDFSKALRFFSYLSIVLIFLGGLGAILVNTIPNNYLSSPTGCVYVPLDTSWTVVSVIVSVLVLLIGQMVLVGLLIYPLHKHSNEKSCLAVSGISCCCFRGSQLQRRSSGDKIQSHHESSLKKIRKILRKTLIFSIIIVVSDIVFYVVSTFAFSEQDNRRIPTMLYDIATFANLVFVFSSIGDWKRILRMTPPVPRISFSLNTPHGSYVDHSRSR